MGRRPISVRWVETNTGDAEKFGENLNIRSRLAAREIQAPGQDAIFAPTPPLDSLRMILSMATTDFPNRPAHVRDPNSDQRTQVLLIDISRAYFNARTSDDDPVYVQLPPEMNQGSEVCGLLRRHMYGTRRAAEGWQDEYSATLIAAGFTQGKASACVFVHPVRGIAVSVHGDDFTATGPKSELDRFEQVMRQHYELTVGGRLGPGPADDKEATILNRVVRWSDEGIQYEADPRQVERLLDEMELAADGVKGVVTPSVKPLPHQVAEELPLTEDQHTRFRALAARAN